MKRNILSEGIIRYDKKYGPLNHGALSLSLYIYMYMNIC